jgi:hypothetical protein
MFLSCVFCRLNETGFMFFKALVWGGQSWAAPSTASKLSPYILEII